MRLSRKYGTYLAITLVAVNLAAGIFLLWGIEPLLSQLELRMSVDFNPAARINPVMTDNRPLLWLFLAAMILLSLLLAGVQLLMFHLQVLRPLRKTVEQATAVAGGDFTADLSVDEKLPEEIVALRRAIRFTRDRMQNYVNRLQASRLREHENTRPQEKNSQINSDFLSGVGGELKNPLSLVSGAAQLLQQNLAALPSPADGHADWQRQCQLILHGTEKLNAMIDKLLSLSHLDPGHYAVRRTVIHTADFLQALDEQYRQPAERRKIALTCHYSPDQPDLILCDRDMLLNGFGLLLSGIIRTSPIGSEVSYGCISSGAKVIFWLKAPPTEKMHLPLAALYRKNFLNPASSRAEQLSGTLMLNLTIVQASLELIRGAVSVLGPDDEGSEFMIAFSSDDILPPVTESAGVHMASNLSSAAATQRFRYRELLHQNLSSALARKLQVALFGSDDSIRQLLEEVFRRENHQLVEFADEEEGVQLLSDSAAGWDLLLIDWEPQFRPVVFLKKLREQLGEKMPPVVMMVPWLDSVERDQWMRVGVAEIWRKPLDIQQLRTQLGMLSRGEKYPGHPSIL